MKLLLDAGAHVAIDRGDAAMWRRLKAAVAERDELVTHGGVVAQAWRGGARDVALAKALAAIDVRPFDAWLGRAAGELLGRARRGDVIAAALVALADDGDQILCAEPAALEPLARNAGIDVELIPV